MKERIGYIDFEAGIMTLWIILCHAYLYAGLTCLEFTQDVSKLPMWLSTTFDADGSLHIRYLSVAFPYLFFVMPWFFYKSGMFFTKISALALIQKDAKKLLLPFLTWGGVGYITYLLFSVVEHSLTFRSATYSVLRNIFLTGAPPVNIALWFLLTLFLARQIMNFVLPDRNNKSIAYHFYIVGIAVISIGIGYILYKFNNGYIPFWTANTATGCCFFALGYWLRDYQYNKWVTWVSICAFALCCISGFSIVVPMNNTCPQGHYLLWMPEALAGIIVFMNICKHIFRTNVLIDSIKWIGEHAMEIYVTHYLVCMIIYKSLVNYGTEKLSRYSLLLIFSAYIILVLCVIIMSKYRLNIKNLAQNE